MFRRNTRNYLQGSTRTPKKKVEGRKFCYLHGVISRNISLLTGAPARISATVTKNSCGVLGGKAS
jgi:hypothetical protein